MGYKINIRGPFAWENLLRDSNIELTDSNGYFASSTLQGALDELYNNSGGGTTWNIISTNTTASKSNGYIVDTSGGQVTLTLPMFADTGDIIEIVDYSGSFETNNCVVARNGHNIMGLAEDFNCNIDNMGIEFVYVDSTQGWKVVDVVAGGGSSSSSGGSGIVWSVESSSVTSQTGNGYMMDNSSIANTVTLHSSPSVGDIVSVADLTGDFQINNCEIIRNGSKIQGLEENILLATKNQRITLVYSGGDIGWIITELEPNSNQFEYMPYAVMHVQDQKPQGTAGGNNIAGTQVRTLNTVLTNDIVGASLNSNQITLPAGDYWIEGDVPAYGVVGHKLRLYSVTAGVYVSEGSSENVNITDRGVTRSFLRAHVALAATTTLEVRHYTANVITNGLGWAVAQGVEVYTNLKITKIGGNYAPKPVVSSARLQPIAGVDITGGIMGFDISKTGANELTISKGQCLDVSLSETLALTSNATLTIPSVANTIYHIFVVRLTTDVYTVKAYTTEAGVASDTDVDAFRWIGFVRTKSDSTIVGFTMNGDLINFHVASENFIAANIGTSYVQIDHSTVLPVSRIKEIEYGVGYVSSTTYRCLASDDGTNTSFFVGYTGSTSGNDHSGAWGFGDNQKASLKPFSSTRYFVGANAGVDLLCQAVRIWR